MKTCKKIVAKNKSPSIALLLILVIVSALFMYIPIARADVPTYVYITVSPDPVGLGQQTSLVMWLDKIEPTASGPSGGRWNFTVQITKPDGTTASLGPLIADPASYAYTSYTPDQIGSYTLQVIFSGKQVKGVGGLIPIPVNDYYDPSNFTATLTVQQEPINPSPQTPLPAGFWTRPINAQNQLWSTISGNWLGLGGTSFGNTAYNATGNFNPYTKAPNSAHIAWTKPLIFGGQTGGELGGTSTSNYYTGKSYEPMMTPPVIINGVLYYNAPMPPKEGFYAVDLRTGQTLWWQNSSGPLTTLGAASIAGLGIPGYPGISCGQVFNYHSPNEEGSRAYLWYMGASIPAGFAGAGLPTSWYMYDANTGELVLTLSNAITGGTRVEGPNGELMLYFLDGTHNWLILWNSTKAIGAGAPVSTGQWAWRPPTGAILNWSQGIQWNVTVPAVPGQVISSVNSGVILAITGNSFVTMNSQMEVGYDANTGAKLWSLNRTLPIGSTAYGLMGPVVNGIYTEFHRATLEWFGYDVYSGNQIWGPVKVSTSAWGVQQQAVVDGYGNTYAEAMDGIHALDLKTGTKLWDFIGDSSGADFPGFTNYPFLAASPVLADGKVFAATGNSHSDPLFRGARLYAIDATSGKQVWEVSGFYLATIAVADGYLVAFNGYDNQIYAYGMGPSKTTVAATLGANGAFAIQGAVTDISAGSQQLAVASNFPNGLPCVSDDSMSQFMEAVYMQQPMSSTTGVEVTLYATGPNGNTQTIGRATTDISGTYGISWTPPTAGLYTITAAFDGTKSYYASTAETRLAVGSASASAAPTSPGQAQPPGSSAATTTYIAIAALIIIILVIVAAIALRRRK